MITVEYFDKKAWELYSENAHKIAFQERKPASNDRIDFALMAIKEGTPMGYMTCRELEADTLYWQFGGAFPGTKGTTWSWWAYLAFVDWCREKYKRVTTIIENTNLPMLKMAMKVGFRINGTRFYAGSILVELVLELK